MRLVILAVVWSLGGHLKQAKITGTFFHPVCNRYVLAALVLGVADGSRCFFLFFL